MYRIKILSSLVISVVLFFLTVSGGYAQEDFLVDNQVHYEIQEGGLTKVTNHLTIENIKSEVYATSFKLYLLSIEPLDVYAREEDAILKVSEIKDGGNTTLIIDFDKAIVGKNKTRSIEVGFNEKSFATRTGEVWEVAIPRLTNENTFRTYNVALSVPDTFGQEAYISPTENSREYKQNRNYYYFNKDKVSKSAITAGFGKFQVFNFNLSYHLENPLGKNAVVEVALPPDTSLQKVRYEEIEPKPENIRLDEDGNWLAKYTLNARQRVDLSVNGSVQIFTASRKLFSLDSRSYTQNLQATEHWQVDDPIIEKLASTLKTPENIYRFVVDTLNYDYERVKPNIERSGALKALENPNSSTCMEFTDLFVTLARAAGIPAREVNGFAYTENTKIQPLSLVTDVLHAWPEYWDSEQNTWVSVDPTWEKTTGGVDYFNKLDLRHFAFVLHGASSTLPYPPGSYKLGADPQKDVYVTFGQLQTDNATSIEIIARKSAPFPIINQKVTYQIANTGSAALYGLSPRVLFDKKVTDSMFVEVLPPFSSIESEVNIPFSLLGRNTPQEIVITANGENITLLGNKNLLIIYNLISIFVILLITMIIIMHKTGKLKFLAHFIPLRRIPRT